MVQYNLEGKRQLILQRSDDTFPQDTYIWLTFSNRNMTAKVLKSMSIKYQSDMFHLLEWFLVNTDLRVFHVYNI